jgi:hypothetical protein
VSIAVYVFTLSCFLASTLAFLNLKGETGKMRRLALTMALACVLSVVARAGEIPTTGVIATPTPSPVTAYGEIHTTGVATAGEIHSTGEAAPEASTALTIILTLISIVS